MGRTDDVCRPGAGCVGRAVEDVSAGNSWVLMDIVDMLGGACSGGGGPTSCDTDDDRVTVCAGGVCWDGLCEGAWLPSGGGGAAGPAGLTGRPVDRI